MPSLGRDLGFFAFAVQRVAGIDVNEDRKKALARAVEQRSSEVCGGDVAAYRERIEDGPGGEAETVRLAAELSVGETHFFRQAEHWRALSESVLPERLRLHGSKQQVRLLSAGCATGEEAYTLAIVLEQVSTLSESARPPVLGVDINEGFLEHARRASYGSWAFRGVPDSVRDTCFQRDGPRFEVRPQFRRLVEFRQANLHQDPLLWKEGAYDIVFLRNVVMYHTPEATRRLIGQVARALRPGGVLFLGHAETLRGVSDAFHLVHTHDAFYYRVKTKEERASARPFRPPVVVGPAIGEALRLDANTDWATAIDDASRRIESLGRRPERTALGQAPQVSAPRDALCEVLALVHTKRFDAAEQLLRGFSPSDRVRTDVLVIEAVLDVNRGRVNEAIKRLDVVLALDEFHADARHLLALCQEQSGDVSAAAETNRTSIYLDRAFAAPHIQAARLAKLAGKLDAAGRALQRALELLPEEQERRILLFGGGFDRHALERVCRQALEELRGRVA